MASSSSWTGQSGYEDFDLFIDPNGGEAYGPEENTGFSGPSHDYSTFRQQTGLPTGSMSALVFNNGDVNMADNDFNAVPDFNNPYTGPMDGYNSGINFDMPDYDNSHFGASSMEDYVDPTAVYEPQPPPVRMWPGMHSQQAAEQAKAAALAKQQQKIEQHRMMQQHRQSLPSSSTPAVSASSSSKGKQRAGSHIMTDAVAERKISDLLETMRHKSAISPIQEDDEEESASARQKREEEEMDEDERLLASEEGKKLSSKERRQLRNKVSARAFRSRRKEYISQLEGDLANKASEANDLRLINRKLLEENNQLKNLTRTVLSHPAFHTFLEDMSRNPTFVPPPAEMIAPTSTIDAPTEEATPTAAEVKQENFEQFQNSSFRGQQEDIQVNSVQVSQDSTLDMSMLNLGNNHWSQQSSGFNFQPQVYAVFKVPAGPSHAEIVSVKSTTDLPVSPVTTRLSTTVSSASSIDLSRPLNGTGDCLAQIDMLSDALSDALMPTGSGTTRVL